MSKFHINKHGVPAPCKATKGNCPLGGDDSHFRSEEEAQAFVNNRMENEYGLLGGTPSPEKMKYEDIIEKINNGDYDIKNTLNKKQYPENYVFDENKSVKWNKEEVVRQNEEIKKAIKSKFDGQNQFKRDVIQYILEHQLLSGSKLNENQAEKIYRKGWEDGHLKRIATSISSGYHSVMIEIEDLINFIGDII